MDCDTVRAEISSAIDEGLALSPAAGEHLASCLRCEEWQEKAHRLRRATLRPVGAAQTLHPDPLVLPSRFRLHRWLRLTLAWTGITLVGWNVTTVMAARTGAAVHLERHQAAFSVALGLSFLFVAWRPDRAYGMVPFAMTFTAALSFAAIFDLVHGTSTLPRESRHLIELGGLALLWLLGAAAGPSRRGRSKGPAATE